MSRDTSLETMSEPIMKHAPLVITVYTRLDHFRRCVESLAKSDGAGDSELHVVSDAPAREEHREAVEKVRRFASAIAGFGKVVPHFRERNLGARDSTLGIIEDILENHDRLIFMEDDVIVSPHFIRFMNEGLDRYVDDPDILAICSYRLPFRMPLWYRKDVYLGRRYSPWGVGLWREKWGAMDLTPRNRYFELMSDTALARRARSVGRDYLDLLRADSEGAIDAIDVRVCYHQIVRKQYCLFPRVSLSANRGFDGSGMHCSVSDRFDARLDERPAYSIRFPEKLVESGTVMRRFRDFEDGREGPIKEFLKLARRAYRKLVRLASRSEAV